jgi:hypothetical protein
VPERWWDRLALGLALALMIATAWLYWQALLMLAKAGS